ncbi:hypothetical protein Hypma_013094 [Hypsizygus marmoreus]|uniref:Uncharacterized protein n=1 Tax=Hypsizygus marmoreus TaxID=39966 RepID=A0A369JCL5_HYPMA|nr:hypothetical protein Hypma_013094 [Hypsizygus marmoreus]
MKLFNVFLIALAVVGPSSAAPAAPAAPAASTADSLASTNDQVHRRLSYDDIHEGMVIRATPLNMEKRCRGDKKSKIFHPTLIISTKGAKPLVSPISNKNLLEPFVDINTLAPSLALSGMIYVGHPCSLDSIKKVEPWLGKVGELRATSEEMRAVKAKIAESQEASATASSKSAVPTHKA